MKKKVIIIANDYLPNNGGIARLCFELKKVLALNGHEVVVITKKNKGKDYEKDLNVIRLIRVRLFFELSVFKYLFFHSTKSDIIITDTFHPCGVLPMLLGRRTFVLAHGAELLPSKSLFKRLFFDRYRNFVLRSATKVIANSKYTMDLVNSCSKSSNVVAIPLSVDENIFFPVSERKRANNILKLCSISRIEKFKGHDFIIETISELPEYYKNRISFNIAGKGPYLNELQEKIVLYKLQKNVKLLGFIANSDLRDFYISSDLFILCTREDLENNHVEGFGLVFLEAQACGIPAIGTNTGGIPDAIEDDNGGWLVEADNKKQLSELLIKIIDNIDVVIESGKMARKRVEEKCTWNTYYENLINEFDK